MCPCIAVAIGCPVLSAVCNIAICDDLHKVSSPTDGNELISADERCICSSCCSNFGRFTERCCLSGKTCCGIRHDITVFFTRLALTVGIVLPLFIVTWILGVPLFIHAVVVEKFSGAVLDARAACRDRGGRDFGACCTFTPRAYDDHAAAGGDSINLTDQEQVLLEREAAGIGRPLLKASGLLGLNLDTFLRRTLIFSILARIGYSFSCYWVQIECDRYIADTSIALSDASDVYHTWFRTLIASLEGFALLCEGKLVRAHLRAACGTGAHSAHSPPPPPHLSLSLSLSLSSQ